MESSPLPLTSPSLPLFPLHSLISSWPCAPGGADSRGTGAERQRLLTERCSADGRPPAWCSPRDAAVPVLLLLQVLHQSWCISKPGSEHREVEGCRCRQRSKDQILIKAKEQRKAQISKSQSSEQWGKLAQIYLGPCAALLQNSLLLILYSGASIKGERKVNSKPGMAEDCYLRRGRPAQMFPFTTR